jgi:hypothetical protein
MTTVEEHQEPQRKSLSASSVRRWATLFQPTSVLTPAQQHGLTAQRPRGWQRDALCAQADPDAWFPEQSNAAPPQVFTVCGRCSVRRSCLASALLRHEEGVWAGTTEADRRHLYGLLKADVSVDRVLDAALASQSMFSALLEGVA